MISLAGSLGAQHYFSYEYGLQVFDLCADQICKLVENPSIDIGRATESILHYQNVIWFLFWFAASELGAVPTMKYSVMGGGRVNPEVSREVTILVDTSLASQPLLACETK